MSIEVFPPRIAPPEADAAPLSSFDAIVVSALGYADGGFQFRNPITTAAVLPDFVPKVGGDSVSAAAFSYIVHGGLKPATGAHLP